MCCLLRSPGLDFPPENATALMHWMDKARERCLGSSAERYARAREHLECLYRRVHRPARVVETVFGFR